MSLYHITRLNRRQRREGARLLLAMREVYPGDVDGALYRDARKLNPKLPEPRMHNVRIHDASET